MTTLMIQCEVLPPRRSRQVDQESPCSTVYCACYCVLVKVYHPRTQAFVSRTYHHSRSLMLMRPLPEPPTATFPVATRLPSIDDDAVLAFFHWRCIYCACSLQFALLLGNSELEL
jgi:hypothetical protein